jgi:N4-(beta-N-acetylglucosaminyl)-L-asparaginase
MPTRRQFLTMCALAGAGLRAESRAERPPTPLVASTWGFGRASNAAAWPVIHAGGKALDACEQGARAAESDPLNTTVGLGGLPDRDGHVTLDACIMDHDGRAGSVCFLEGIEHPTSVARRVMEQTPHVMLAGEGARRFAIAQGFGERDLLTEHARREWTEWRRHGRYEPRINPERHDTLGILAIDRSGHLGGACTTSGMAFKMHGRVGDSPIIGAALFVDGKVGAVTATGHGEYVMRTLGSFLVVELMRQGRSPQDACRKAVQRIAVEIGSGAEDVQVGYLAVSADGRLGACSVQPGFQYAVRDAERDEVLEAESWFVGD